MSGPDIIIVMTDQERAAPPYEDPQLRAWRDRTLRGARWFDDHGVSFDRHYTGSLACVPSRPTLFTGHYPDLHGVTQTDGFAKKPGDSRMRWLRTGEVPTLGNWFRAAGYDTYYAGKWHISHADLLDDDGAPLPTTDDAGNVDADAVQAYLDADPLHPFGFSGWVGPEPHGAPFANTGLVRDPLTATQACSWLRDRYTRRRGGDDAALRPFLLVASFVNPHDIVMFPAWVRRNPLAPSPSDPPPVPPGPTDDEDLATKPAAQAAYRAAYPTGYGPPTVVSAAYTEHAQLYRDMYYRLHAEVDGSIDAVRTAVTEGADDAVLVRTADHGELLGAHGGLHQKWFTLYDEATRVPFTLVRLGAMATGPRRITEMATSHVDLVPTLLAAAGIDEEATAAELRRSFSEVHPLPGRNLMPIVDGADPDADRTVYLMTRDNILEGDSRASVVARSLGQEVDPPANMRIDVPADVAANFEAIVTRVGATVPGGGGHRWKLVRSFDDPATWTDPGVRHLAATGPAGPTYRTAPLEDQWELYDLQADAIEAVNRWHDPDLSELRSLLVAKLEEERSRSVPLRNQPWDYAIRQPVGPE